MKTTKRFISIMLSVVIIITSVIGINITAHATSISQSQAISWATSQKAKLWIMTDNTVPNALI